MGPHAATEPLAIETAKRVLNGLLQHGMTGPLDIDPDVMADMMPTLILRQVHRLIADAGQKGRIGFPDVLSFALDTQIPNLDLVSAELSEVSQSVTPNDPRNLDMAVNALREYRRTKRAWELGLKLADCAGDPAERVRIAAELVALSEESAARGNMSLLERAYSMQYNPEETPPPDETCMVIGDIPIAARGGLSAVQGKSKVGKSAVVSAILGAAHRGEYQAQGDTLCIGWHGGASGAIIHLDTEQSRGDWHSLVSRAVHRSGLAGVSSRLVSLPLVMFARSERLEVLRQSMEYESTRRGGVDVVVIDGVADLCLSPNDETEALELVSQLMALAARYHCAIFCILHENPGTDQGKTRGHLGSELNRKAFANIRIDKDAETSVSTLYGTDMRKREIPRVHGFCFGWDDAAGMHGFQGRADGVRAARAEAEKAEKARKELAPIFAEIGTNLTCPDLSPSEAADIERDNSGTNKRATVDAMKKRMQRAESLGVLRKTTPGRWAMNESGQSGQGRDN